MPTLTLTNLGQLDGDYEFDFSVSPFDYEEADLIQQVSSVRTDEIWPEWLRGNAMLQVGIAVVVLKRNNRDATRELLGKAPLGSLRFVFPEDDAGPPDQGNDDAPNGSGDTSG
jgi:hypothetical protein